MRIRNKLVLFIPLLLAYSCQRSPTGRKQLALASDQQMEAMGEQAFAEMKQKQAALQDPKTNAYIQCIAKAITNSLDNKREWEVVVFDEPSANAFALPGGKIGVHSGLLKVARNQDQVATVIGHEVGHVVADHSKERVSEALVAQGGLSVAQAILANKESPKHNLLLAALGIGAQVGVLLPHSRAQESEADIIGLDLMARSGFQPQESVALWHNMEAQGGGQPPQFLSTHPSHETRIQQLQEHMAQAEQERAQSPHRPNCGASPL